MTKFVKVAALGAALVGLAGVANAASYDIAVTTSYGGSYGGPAGTSLGGGSPSPDTGFVTFTNNGSTTFVGNIGYTAVSNSAGDLSFNALGVTLAPGASVYEAINNESSNVGGFNGPYNTVPQPGVILTMSGAFNGSAATLTVNDSQIHSGVSRTNPFGVVLDNYVLQGGDPLGRDTGDGYEEAQAFGHYTFLSGGVPEPATWAMLLVGFGGLGAAIRSRRKQEAALATA